jgi:hypothetical protein
VHGLGSLCARWPPSPCLAPSVMSAPSVVQAVIKRCNRPWKRRNSTTPHIQTLSTQLTTIRSHLRASARGVTCTVNRLALQREREHYTLPGTNGAFWSYNTRWIGTATVECAVTIGIHVMARVLLQTVHSRFQNRYRNRVTNSTQAFSKSILK